MANHRFDFIIGHDVHQAAVYTNTAVRHRKGVDVFRHVHLIVHRLTVNVIAQRGSNFTQTLAVVAGRRSNGRFCIHILTGLVAQRLHLFITQREGLKGTRAGV